MAHSAPFTTSADTHVDTSRTLFAPVIKKKPSLNNADKAFIDKCVRHFATVEGAVRDQIRIRTTTRHAGRTICNVYGLPTVSKEDIDQLDVLSDRVQNVTINLPEQYIRVELCKEEGNARKKRRRGRGTTEHTEWKLDTVASEDRRHVKRILDAVEDFDELECQLTVEIEAGDGYQLNITPCESIKLTSVQKLARNYRSLIQSVSLDFPGKRLILSIST